MIQGLLSWAVDHWTELESRVALLSLGRDDGPVRPLDLPSGAFVAVLEGVIREVPERAARLDALTAEARRDPEEIRAEAAAERRRQIRSALVAFGG